MEDVKVVSVVDIKPPLQSKINATQIASAIAVPIAAWVGSKFHLTEEVQVALVVVLSWAFNALTIVIKTFYTSTITPQSAKNMDFVMRDTPLVVVSKPEST